MPLDETPTLVALLIAVERAAIEELYRSLAAAGHGDLAPASATVFQHIRPGGSAVDELARLGHMTEAAVREQAAAMASAGYVDFADGDRVVLTARGEAAVAAGMAALQRIEGRWREELGAAGYGAFASALARLNLGRATP